MLLLGFPAPTLSGDVGKEKDCHVEEKVLLEPSPYDYLAIFLLKTLSHYFRSVPSRKNKDLKTRKSMKCFVGYVCFIHFSPRPAKTQPMCVCQPVRV